LVPKLKETHVELIIDRLTELTDAANKDAELRDISLAGTIPKAGALTIALRTVIIEIPSNTQVSGILITRLLPRLQSQVSPLTYTHPAHD
jgi:hypothetical protein